MTYYIWVYYSVVLPQLRRGDAAMALVVPQHVVDLWVALLV